MCDIIDHLEAAGIDHNQLRQVLKKEPGPVSGKWSSVSISLLVLSAVDEAWAKRGPTPPD